MKEKNKGFKSEWNRDLKTNLIARKQQQNVPKNCEGK